MASCTSCGYDVTGKKFCPECGTPVQPAENVESENNTPNICPRCNGVVKPGAAFCMHCGSSLSTQTAVATATPTPSVQPESLTQTCIACHSEVPKEMAFCTNCGQSMRTNTASDVPATPVAPVCANCGIQNNPGVNFCAQCGSPLSHGPVPQTMFAQPQQYSQPYSQYPQQSPQYGAQYPQQPMMNQQPMVLRCPVCMAMAPLGTPNCTSCHTSLANVAPTPANMPAQYQQGGMGGMFQGPGGNMAMGALGGAAAIIGGEVLLHEFEHGFDRNRGGGDGLLGGLGDLANDVGLF
jgi:predicted amidophosphoribosyltransferase